MVDVPLVRVRGGNHAGAELANDFLGDLNHRLTRVGQVGFQNVFVGRVVGGEVNGAEGMGGREVFGPDRARAAVRQPEERDAFAPQPQVPQRVDGLLHANHAEFARLIRPAGLRVVSLASAHVAARVNHQLNRDAGLDGGADQPRVGLLVILVREEEQERRRQRIHGEFARGRG